ncbi:bifunctional diaminohydroxyphosphoribosylaminopyrimidine deaminase/5-amino-6-(5-phosphoribosylamino)uracil reductase RibD [uncultured Cetobacterium sp.]|uniref:bifunctional diaminohydroxyphosphoribosylaminopyrimidine deaminase/5-amino-6-(5-phosphoribosylamino)uracil reductase RibD n=2 Tax=uncultured Cetobacterium sp. TaxID=527638 RepID=UPI00263310E1|nr:bifunctional diaminohydroxyphosphoribosylaminopyrimidine deaminase/5-amino-6-(5-phosphoribosylamino)uracil reductase RibD [uncultured Cetobacterium sp.]
MHNKFMQIALNEANKGIGAVNPNPLVGAVIVKNKTIISTGYHKSYGDAHAEVNAINKAKNQTEGATIYVTLEPCSHFGKTPPCVDLIIKSKFKTCVIGTSDPNPLVAGKGIEKLKNSGIEVIFGIMKKECEDINKVFFKYISTKLPFIFIKCGITLDGKIATKNFSSKWITNELAREKVQKYRNYFSGILVGANTVIQDNPSLKCSLKSGRNPFRLILDRNLTISNECNIIYNNEDSKTIIITLQENENSDKYNTFKNNFNISFILIEKNNTLKDILFKIGELGIDSILIEGGENVISQFFKENLFDGGEIIVAPKILGDSNAISFINGFSPNLIQDAFSLDNIKINLYGNNIGFEFYKEEGCLLV